MGRGTSSPIVIIGAGPTGLAAAWRLNQLGADWLLIERNDYPGGLAASFESEGFTWDLGGHVIFSHYPAYDQMLDRVIRPEDWLWHERVAYIRMRDRWVPYPFQLNVWQLPEEDAWACVQGLLHLGTRRAPKDERSFQALIDTVFGDGIARLFMNPYNFKVWAHPLDTMSAGWIADRVARPDVERVVSNLVFKRADVSWGPNNRFRFPSVGGTGQIWRRLAAELPDDRIRLGTEATGISTARRRISLAGGDALDYGTVINTMPLDRLVAISDLNQLRPAAEDLCHTSVHVVGLGLRGGPTAEIRGHCWMYFPDPSIPFYRATLFSNYSPRNAPAGHWSLMLETSESPHKPVDQAGIVDESIRGCLAAGLIRSADEVAATWHAKAEYGYPVPTLQRDAALAILLPALEERGVFSRGRFGAWRYEVGNMDHSFIQGIEVAEKVVSG